jgi:glycosyltransferase involved in cell wall biosynthesis
LRQTVISTWPPSSYHGWGVYGLNLALAWAEDPDVALVCTRPVDPALLALDPDGLAKLQPMAQASARLADQLAGRPDGVSVRAPVLQSLDGKLKIARGDGTVVWGPQNLGVLFLESARLTRDAVDRGSRLDLILAGSSWNAALLRAHGLERVRTVLQGVDPALFHPGPRTGRLHGRDVSGRFLVFSGGKLERRKGQDLVLAAFKVFAARHPDALLVTAWRNFWGKAAATVDASGLVAPLAFDADGRPDPTAWAVAGGVAAEQVLDLGALPNAAMPAVLREMDVAVFPNRCEGGTNLVAMEAMACGAPAILSANTGHLDLIDGENCFPLTRQGALPGDEAGVDGVPGWGESDVEEIVAALEAAYADREAARRRGLAGAKTLERFTWAATARGVKQAVLSVL